MRRLVAADSLRSNNAASARHGAALRRQWSHRPGGISGGVVEVDEQARARLAVHVATDVTLTGRVLGQQDRTGPEHPLGAVAHLDLHGTSQIHDELPSRRGVEVELVLTGDGTEL